MKDRPKINIRSKNQKIRIREKTPSPSSLVKESDTTPSILDQLIRSELWMRFKWHFISGLGGITIILLILFFSGTARMDGKESTKSQDPVLLDLNLNNHPDDSELFGFDLRQFRVDLRNILRENISFEEFFSAQQIPDKIADKAGILLQNEALTELEAGREYFLISRKNTQQPEAYLVYEQNTSKFAIISLSEEPQLRWFINKVERKMQVKAAVIKTDLWDAIIDGGMHRTVIEKMEEALKWSVDFYHVQPGDRFKVVYEELWTNGKITGTGQLQAAFFETHGRYIHAFYIADAENPGFYDEIGRSIQRGFLKSPVKYGRISSRYNLERIHPVLGDKRPHFGTDYAAPAGTPIFAVAAGNIIAAEFTGNNGNFVKIRHNNNYQTQYLHMQGFASNLRVGTRVKQGDIIGYVGQTGLATGPHVCFRFWKNGKQVDPLLEKDVGLSNFSPLNEADFILRKDSLLHLMDRVAFF